MEKNNEKITPDKNGGYNIDWTELYPILKRYQKEMDCAAYEGRFMEMMDEVEKTYGYSAEEAMLALKDIFYHAYLKRINKQ